MRALAYSLFGVFDKALSDYDAALKIKPDFPDGTEYPHPGPTTSSGVRPTARRT